MTEAEPSDGWGPRVHRAVKQPATLAAFTVAALALVLLVFFAGRWSTRIVLPGGESLAARPPPDFNWEIYKLYNQDVAANLTEREARAHYVREGRREGRIHKAVPVLLTYSASMGLCNQFLAHLNVLAIAQLLPGVTVQVSQAYTRVGHDQNVRWQRIPAEALLDVDRMIQYWRGKGLPLAKEVNTTGCIKVDLGPGFTHIDKGDWSHSVEEAVEYFARNISMHVRPVLQARRAGSAGAGAGAEQMPCVHLDLHVPLILLDQNRSLEYMTVAARGLFFAPHVVRVADIITDTLSAAGQSPFQGAHLRLEKDWTPHMHYTEDLVGTYLDAMKHANFTNASATYIASGIFDSWSEEELANLTQRFRDAGVWGKVFHKKSVLHAQVLEEFTQEQEGLIDLLVLARASAFVGDPISSFAAYARELRALNGLPRSTFTSIYYNRFIYDLSHRYWFAPRD